MKKVVYAVIICLFAIGLLTACSERQQKVVVSFETNGGSVVSARQTAVLTVPISQKDGFRIEGWYRDEDFRERVSFPFYPTADCVLYAKWTELATGSLGIKYVKTADGKAFIAANYSIASVSVCVPDVHLGLPVIGIKKGFLQLKQYVVNFCVGKNVTDIEEDFHRCSSLTKFEILGANERYELDGDALCDKKENKIIAYPTALGKSTFTFDKLLAKNAIAYNPKIEKIVFGENADAEDGAFLGLSALKEFSVNEGNSTYKAVDGILYSKNEEELCCYPMNKSGDELVISDNTVTIRNYAFERVPLKKITFGKSVKEYLDTSTAPYLEEYAVASGNKFFIADEGVLYSSDGKTLVRYPCAKSSEYTVNEGTQTIAEYSFSESKVSSVIVAESVEKINAFAFNFCGQLAKIRFEEDSAITAIAENALVGCTQLNNFIITTSHPPQTASALFSATSSDLTIIVPSNAKETYAYYWSFAVPNISDSGRAVENHTVSFDVRGGSEVEPIYGTFIQKSPTATKTGATFLYWEDENGNEVQFPYFIEKDIIFYAVWAEESID